ncbi:MAG: potassium channel family protein [Atopobiaceae bacterium]
MKVFWGVMRRMRVNTILVGYAVFLAMCSVLLRVLEPQTFSSIGGSLWFLFETITTIGYGDVVPTTAACRVIAVLAGLSALVIVGLVTGVVVDFYTELNRVRQNESLAAFDDRMQRVSELSKEDLVQLVKELSQR